MDKKIPKLAIIGGTGALGSGLACRWARAGFSVVVGSRSSEKAEQAAKMIALEIEDASITGTDNRSAAALADIVVVTVPYSTHDAILEDIASEVSGKIVVDATVPLVPPKVGTVQLPAAGPVAVQTKEFLGDDVDVVAAFQNVAADKLRGTGPIDCDILVCGNKKAIRQEIINLIGSLGMRGIHAGPLANATVVESLTSVLITINKQYKLHGAGIRITGDLTFPDPTDG
jgi:NADPH-dependent F420 reductase